MFLLSTVSKQNDGAKITVLYKRVAANVLNTVSITVNLGVGNQSIMCTKGSVDNGFKGEMDFMMS